VIDPEIKSTLLSALAIAAGDSLERAQWSFKGMSPEAMQEQHGASGCTRQAILDMYRRDRDLNTRARQWVQSQ
jgi:hypothetical protein